MKKFIISLILAMVMPWAVVAQQDARGRITSTIVADALAQLPAARQKAYNSAMADLASTGTEGVVQLAGMLVPADKGKNSTVEYALYGLVSHVMASGHEAERDAVCEGLKVAIDNCADNANRAYLMTLLQNCGTAADAPAFVKYLNDQYLQEWAINGLIAIPGTDDVLMELVGTDAAPRQLLAYAVGKKGLKAAESIILKWAAEAGGNDMRAYYKALGRIGGAKSLPLLAKAAKADNYSWEPDGATESYVALIENMAAGGESKQALDAAKKLMKATDKAHVRGAAMNVVFDIEGKKALPVLLQAMKDSDRAYRVNALRRAEPWADGQVFAALDKYVTAKNDSPVKADIINWYGTNHADGQIDVILPNMASGNEEVAQAAIKAAGKIGGEKALNALVGLLGGDKSAQAVASLLSFNGKVNAGIMQALDGNAAMQIDALSIASKRKMTEAAPKVFALLESDNADVQKAAYSALAGVVGSDDFNAVCALVENGAAGHDQALVAALNSSVRNLPKAEQYAKVMPYIQKSKASYKYYPVLAQVGSSDAIAELLNGYEKGQGNAKDYALTSLLSVNNPEMIEVLYGLVAQGKENDAKILPRYADLVKNSDYNAVRKYQLYRKGLEIAKDANVKNTMINGLASTNTYSALLVADKCFADKATAKAAAAAVRTIASKNTGSFGGAPVRSALEKARDVFKAGTKADDGYAVDDINGMLSKLPEAAFVEVLSQVALKPVTIDPATGKAVNPAGVKALKGAALKKANAAATAAAANWAVSGNGVAYTGDVPSVMALDRDYENFELMFEWKGDGGLGVRSTPLVKLGCGKACCSKNGDKECKSAVNPEGEWNTTYVKVLNDRITVIENGVTVIDNKTMPNPYDEAAPVFAAGKIQLASSGKPLAIREMYVRELPATPIFELSAEEAAEGFKVLFDGRSMHNFTGNTTDYIPVDGNIYVTAAYGNGGNLYTVDEYSDFVFRFEFCFEREGVNNGVGIRTPMNVDAAYHGMEIQVLDHDAPIYKNLREYQVHGSVYGIIPAKRIKHPARGEWSTEEIRAEGDHITVTVNGEVIVDGNIREACQGHNVAPDGAKTNPYTVDHKNHPGLFNKSGHVGFLGHGAGVKFRNIRIKDLSKDKKSKK